MDFENKVETLVIEGINELRETRRKRVGLKDLYWYVEEFFDNNILNLRDL